MRHKLISIADLKPAEYNPRKISETNAGKLGKSMGEFGDISGIVWNEQTGHLVTGHQRLEELKGHGGKLDVKRLVIVTTEGLEFPVRVVNWALPTEMAANIAANNACLQGEWDNLLLSHVCSDILDSEIPFESTGFDMDFLDELLASVGDVDTGDEREITEEMTATHSIREVKIEDLPMRPHWIIIRCDTIEELERGTAAVAVLKKDGMYIGQTD